MHWSSPNLRRSYAVRQQRTARRWTDAGTPLGAAYVRLRPLRPRKFRGAWVESWQRVRPPPCRDRAVKRASHCRLAILGFSYDTSMSEKGPRLSRSRDDTPANQNSRPCLNGREVTDFMLNCDDASYQAWWPGVHLQFHTVRRVTGDVGNAVYMDEYVGRFRLKFHAVVTAAIPGKEITWQFIRGVRLPGKLILAPRRSGRGRSDLPRGRGRISRSGPRVRCGFALLAHARIRGCAGRARADRISEATRLAAFAGGNAR